MTLLKRGQIVACDSPSCAEDFIGPWNEAQAQGWIARFDKHYCPTCARHIIEVEREMQSVAVHDDQRTARSIANAEQFADLVVQAGGPRGRVWHKAGVGVRLYFPGNAGYLSFSGADMSDVNRGAATYYPSAMFPNWRRAVSRAVSDYRKQHGRR